MGEDAPSGLLSTRRTSPLRLVAVVGTRPEAVKMAPIVAGARAAAGVELTLLGSGQHPRQMLEALESFGLGLDGDLALYEGGRTLAETTVTALPQLAAGLAAARPDVVLVQGDTTTALAATLAAYYARIPVAHVEAGLRTHDRYDPFPEEMNRRLIDVAATYLFPPTDVAAAHLAAEGLVGENVFVTGNTIIDALRWLRERTQPVLDGPAEPFVDSLRWRGRVLVTAHRRESWGAPLDEVAAALASLAARLPDHAFLLPLHPNPIVRASFRKHAWPANVVVVEPLPYAQFVAALQMSDLVLTDSGGVLEEATALGRPALILRERTERPEAIAAGARLVGLGRRAIEDAVVHALANGNAAAAPSDVFGDGRAASRIVSWLGWRFGLSSIRPAPFSNGAASAQRDAIATFANRTAASSS